MASAREVAADAVGMDGQAEEERAMNAGKDLDRLVAVCKVRLAAEALLKGD